MRSTRREAAAGGGAWGDTLKEAAQDMNYFSTVASREGARADAAEAEVQRLLSVVRNRENTVGQLRDQMRVDRLARAAELAGLKATVEEQRRAVVRLSALAARVPDDHDD